MSIIYSAKLSTVVKRLGLSSVTSESFRSHLAYRSSSLTCSWWSHRRSPNFNFSGAKLLQTGCRCLNSWCPPKVQFGTSSLHFNDKVADISLIYHCSLTIQVFIIID